MYWACRVGTSNFFGVDFRSRVRILCVRGSWSNLYGEVRMLADKPVVSPEQSARVALLTALNRDLNAKIAEVEAAKVVLRQLSAEERRLRAAIGREESHDMAL